jgi:hypothetical protein
MAFHAVKNAVIFLLTEINRHRTPAFMLYILYCKMSISKQKQPPNALKISFNPYMTLKVWINFLRTSFPSTIFNLKNVFFMADPNRLKMILKECTFYSSYFWQMHIPENNKRLLNRFL